MKKFLPYILSVIGLVAGVYLHSFYLKIIDTQLAFVSGQNTLMQSIQQRASQNDEVTFLTKDNKYIVCKYIDPLKLPEEIEQAQEETE